MENLSRLGLSLCVSVLVCLTALADGQDKSATLTRTKGNVKVGTLPVSKDESPGQAQDIIEEKDYVRTGKKSLAELKFTDNSYTRLGAFTLFRFVEEDANYVLEKGEGFFVFPKGKAGATISSPSFSAGILGTTVYLKVSRSRTEYLCLEGRCQIGPHTLGPGERFVIRADQQAYSVPKQNYDIESFLSANDLFTQLGDLPSQDLINAEIENQRAR